MRGDLAQVISGLKEALIKKEMDLSLIKARLDCLDAVNRELTEEIKKFESLAQVNFPRRLHIVGYARSGTTILMDIINSSPYSFIFSELNLHVLQKFSEVSFDHNKDEFITEFTNRKVNELDLIYKGALPPSKVSEFNTPDEYINLLNEKYLYVGDKIAAAYRSFNGIMELDILRDFLIQEEKVGAIFLFSIRRPSENLASVLKMFPEADAIIWSKSIGENMLLLIEAFIKNSHSFIIFHQDIGSNLAGELSKFLGLKFWLDPSLIGLNYQNTRGNNSLIPNQGMHRMDKIYDDLYSILKADGGSVKHSKTDYLVKQIAPVLSDLRKLIDEI